MAFILPVTLTILCVFGALVYLFALPVTALRKYIRPGDVVRKENAAVRKSLGEALKECRLGCGMTQELVAERLEVSRQAVSNGKMEPPIPVPRICWLCRNCTVSARRNC